ncbi:magnesium transporter [Trichococcus ilyis]|jgi:magnesium transporter|uniref:Magnesium transporter MgtE n=1 Tax=Trichococcus ilyis TaxID=640938 RepID=A0A143Z1C1_9LACT|nr:magnesium transporter [Trichococcus ilyis]CZR04247.1 divalent cation transporter [Trichococcus ilyis]SEJ54966.1 magnesium transporter [Trichococcus ilyis]
MELNEMLLQATENKNGVELKELIDNHYPVDVATALFEFEDDELAALLNLLEAKEIAAIIEEAEEELQQGMIGLLDSKKIVKFFAYMSPDDITDILGTFGVEQRKEILGMMRKSDSNEIQMLLGYGPDTAGGIMTTKYIALKSDLSMKAVLQEIRRIGPRTEIIETIYVVDKMSKLIGSADLRDILASAEDIKLEEIMNDNVLSVTPETDQEEVSLIVSKYDLKVIPVVNRKNVILGIITIDDIIDVIVEEQTEDLLMLSGVSKDEKVGSKISTSVSRRLPWLVINLVTAFLASFTVGLFEDVIIQVVALAAAMPIVTGMGGNAGSQTLSVVIRSIALGEVDIKNDWRYVFNEVSLGLINGLVTGLITGIILYVRYDNFFLGLIILIAMIGNLVIAGFFGFLIPLALKKWDLDPAISSSIFLTTATDVFGFFLFLSLAKIFLPHLL